MAWLSNIKLFCAIILIEKMVFAEPIPVSWDKKSDILKRNRSGTRHDHVNDCQYIKGTWSECNPTTTTKTRTLTLKKNQDEVKCEKFKTIEKKCKKLKGCKYDKGSWSKCNVNNEMTRADILRNPSESDASCEKTKLITKTCKNKTDRNSKGQQKPKHKLEETSDSKTKRN